MNCIDRGEAMNLLNEAQVEYDENYKGLGLAKKIISDMKPVEPERPKGKWIDEVNDFGEITAFHCSNCYEDTGFFTRCKSNFCPKCGADMREVNQ